MKRDLYFALRKFKDQAGFSIAEALVGVGLLGVAGTVFFNLNFQITKANQIFNTQSSVQNLSSMIRIWTSSAQNWQATVQKNSAMACLRTVPNTCQNGVSANIDLYDKTGKLILGSTSPRMGFTNDGKICENFQDESSTCNIKANLKWELRCPAGSAHCTPYEEVLTVEFRGKSDFQEAANLSKYNLNFIRSGFDEAQNPLAICAKFNKLYIGKGKTIIANSGISYQSDSYGCIDFIAFKGRGGDVGFRGPQGPAGPLGPRGPQGPPGNVVYLPPPTSTPTSATPTPTGTSIATSGPTPTSGPTTSPTSSPSPTAPPSWRIVAASNNGFSAWLDCDLYATADLELPPSYGSEVWIIGQPVPSNATVIQHAPSGSYTSGKWRYTFEKINGTFEDVYERWIIKAIYVYSSSDFVCRTSGTGAD